MNPRDRRAEHNRKQYKTLPGRMQFLVSNARYRAKKKGIECTITKDFMVELWRLQGGKCAISGADLRLDQTDVVVDKSDSPSIDQIEPGCGYTEENVQLVCSWVNSMKSCFTAEEFKEKILILAKAVRRSNRS